MGCWAGVQLFTSATFILLFHCFFAFLFRSKHMLTPLDSISIVTVSYLSCTTGYGLVAQWLMCISIDLDHTSPIMAKNDISATNTISNATTVNTDFSKVNFPWRRRRSQRAGKRARSFRSGGKSNDFFSKNTNAFKLYRVITRHQNVTIRRLTCHSEYHGPAGHVAADCKKAAQQNAYIKAEEKRQRDAAKRHKARKRFQEKWLAVSESPFTFAGVLYTDNVFYRKPGTSIARKLASARRRRP